MLRRWWLVVKRSDMQLIYVGPYVVGPYRKRKAKKELQSDSGIIYSLCTIDAKRDQYIVHDVYMTRKFPFAGIQIFC